MKHEIGRSIRAALAAATARESADKRAISEPSQQHRQATITKGTGMTTATLGQLIEKHGFEVLDHLDRDLEIPVHAGLQAQGDLFIIPAEPNQGSRQGTAVPPDGIAVIEAVNGGHEHRLFAGQPGTAFFIPAGARGQDIGLLECTEPAYVAHPEHAYAGIAPGTYTLRGQREHADEERLVAD